MTGETCRLNSCPKSRKRYSTLCSMHGARLSRTGTTEPTKYSHGSLDEKYWRRVTQGAGPCWGWTGSISSAGYGVLASASERIYVHRFSWTVHFGPIPEGLLVCHRCDNPPCSNPEHLFLGTAADNLADAARKGRFNKSRTPDRGFLGYEGAAEIRRLRDIGTPYGKIAKTFGISRAAVVDAATGRTWKTLPTLASPCDTRRMADGTYEETE